MENLFNKCPQALFIVAAGTNLIPEVRFEHVVTGKWAHMVIHRGDERIIIPISVLRVVDSTTFIKRHAFVKDATPDQMEQFAADVVVGKDAGMSWGHPHTKFSVVKNKLVIMSMMTEITLNATAAVRSSLAEFVRKHADFRRNTPELKVPKVSPRTEELVDGDAL